MAADVSQAIADTLGNLDGVTVYPFATDNPVVPCVVVAGQIRTDWRRTMSQSPLYTVQLQLLVQRVDAQAADEALGELEANVAAALMDDPTLGGVVEYCDPVESNTFGLFATGGGTDYFGCFMILEVQPA